MHPSQTILNHDYGVSRMKKKTSEKKLAWWQLSLFGVGCIIGTGYFLGASIAIQKAGPAVLLAYLVAGIGTWIVFWALAKLTAEHPEKGSFRTYAKQAYGEWAGFSNGWVYWSAEMLIMGSQLTALSIFAQYWLPGVPIWIFATIFAALGLLIIAMGVQKVEQMENLFGLMKVAAIVMFVIIATAASFGMFDRPAQTNNALSSPFVFGYVGLWTSLLYAFYAFGGIEVMGLVAKDLEDPKDAPKAGRIMLTILTILYLSSIFLVIKLTSIKKINADESAFLTALIQYDLPWVPHLFNSILIIAGFSTMVASLYAVTTMIVTLSEEGDAPKLFSKKGKLQVPLPAFLLTSMVVLISIVVALLLPDKIFEYITTAAGLMLLYTWVFILFSYRKLMAKAFKDYVKLSIAFMFIVIAVCGTLFDSMSRIGFFVSIAFISIIASS